MAKPGDVLINRFSGEKVIFVKTTSETSGQELQFIYEIRPGKVMPFPHQHPKQNERFEALEGKCSLYIKKKLITLKKGDSFTVLPGVVHQPQNNSKKPMRVMVTLTPALHTEEGLETLFFLAQKGKVNRHGKASFLQLAVIAYTYPGESYLGFIPCWLQRMALWILGPLGLMLGYKATYK